MWIGGHHSQTCTCKLAGKPRGRLVCSIEIGRCLASVDEHPNYVRAQRLQATPSPATNGGGGETATRMQELCVNIWIEINNHDTYRGLFYKYLDCDHNHDVN